ncbi:MAG: site-specific integrase [Candidatus Caldarchaeum sp.]
MKYRSREGKYGTIWQIAEGVRVTTTKNMTYELSIEHNGQRVRKRFQSLDTALQAAELAAAKMGLDTTKYEKSYTFEQAANDWLETNKTRWTSSTVERYVGLLNNFIIPALGSKRIDRISRSDVKKLIAEISQIRSAKTAELVHAVISGVFTEAIDNGYTRENPCSGLLRKILPPKRKRTSKPDPFTRDELEKVLQAAKAHLPRSIYTILNIMARSGMRLGEALAMHIDHIDMNNSQYMITETIRKGKLGAPKTGRRLIDLPERLMCELRDYITHLRKEALKEGKVVGYLFSGITERMVQRGLERACMIAKVRRRHPHDLRHTYATLMLIEHVSPAYIQKQLGHHSITMTVDTYGHWIPGEGRKQADEVWRKQPPNAKPLRLHDTTALKESK